RFPADLVASLHEKSESGGFDAAMSYAYVGSLRHEGSATELDWLLAELASPAATRSEPYRRAMRTRIQAVALSAALRTHAIDALLDHAWRTPWIHERRELLATAANIAGGRTSSRAGRPTLGLR